MAIFNSELQRSQQREADERAPLDEPFLEPRDTTKLDKKPRGRARRPSAHPLR